MNTIHIRASFPFPADEIREGDGCRALRRRPRNERGSRSNRVHRAVKESMRRA